MSPTLHERLAQRSLAGRYELFLGVGGGLTVLGLIFFLQALGSGNGERAWQVFHVNWLYFSGLAFGSVAFVAVQKITNAKWSGMIIRFASASVAFLPISLVALLIIFTLGYAPVYGPMAAALHELQHGKAIWLSHPFMLARLAIGLGVLAVLGWKLVLADIVPDLLAVRSPGPRRPPGAYDRLDPGLRGHRGGGGLAAGPDRAARAGVRRDLRDRAHDDGLRRHHGAAAPLVLQPARRVLLHGRVPGRAHAARPHDDLRRLATWASPISSRPNSATTSASFASVSPCSGAT